VVPTTEPPVYTEG